MHKETVSSNSKLDNAKVSEEDPKISGLGAKIDDSGKQTLVEEVENTETNNAQNYGRFQALQDTREYKEELDNEEMDIDKIYWFSEDKVYAHLSGMRYDTDSKNYFTRVTDDEKDL